MDIKFSIVASAIRSDRYKLFYDHVAKSSSVPFEIVFAGHSPPIEKMPDNFKYIVTYANPAWAVEIAVRHAIGKYIVVCADDVFISNGYLDKLDYYQNKLFMEKSLIGGRFKEYEDGVFCDNLLIIDGSCSNSPLSVMGAAYDRKVWNDLGGIDNRFFGVFYDLDMQMRFYEKGYTPFVMPDAYFTHTFEVSRQISLLGLTSEYSRKLCTRFWVDNGIMLKKRLLPVLPITDENIKQSVVCVI